MRRCRPRRKTAERGVEARDELFCRWGVCKEGSQNRCETVVENCCSGQGRAAIALLVELGQEDAKFFYFRLR